MWILYTPVRRSMNPANGRYLYCGGVMESINSSDIQSSPGQDSRTSPAAARQRCYLAPPAPHAEVMWEQMEYLLDHVGSTCFPGCADCARLEQVKRCLLQPFS